jgi:hypothetical protein
LSDICASHEDIYQESSSIPFKNIEKYFNVSATNLKKVFKTYFEKDYSAKYLNEDNNKTEKATKKTQKNCKVL